MTLSFTSIVDAITAGSLIVGIWTAIYGISSWKKEHLGKRKIELAEETLILFYEAKDAIIYIRSPMGVSSETASMASLEGELDHDFAIRKKANIPFLRYSEKQKVFNDLHALHYRFMAQIGKDEAKSFENLRKVMNEIFSSARRLTTLWSRSHSITDEQRESHYKEVDKYEAIFWEDSEEDEINKKLNQIISEIELVCQKVITA